MSTKENYYYYYYYYYRIIIIIIIVMIIIIISCMRAFLTPSNKPWRAGLGAALFRSK